MKNESDWKTELVKSINKLPQHFAWRMEDKFAVGRPDMLVKIPDFAWCFIEAKLVTGPTFGPSPRQWIELQRLDALPATWAVVVGITKEGNYFFGFGEKISVADAPIGDFNFLRGLRSFIIHRMSTESKA